MVNTNIQGVIPLEGPGLVFNPTKNYNRGEYRTLKNMELYNGALQLRRPIRHINSGTTISGINSMPKTAGTDHIKYFLGFNGFIKNGVFAAGLGPDENWQVGGYTKQQYGLFDSADLAQPATVRTPQVYDGHQNHYAVAAFQYNNYTYYVTRKVSQPDNINELRIFRYSTSVSSDTEYSLTVPSTLTPDYLITSFTNFSKQSGSSRVVLRTFIHKDRAFVVTNDKVFFSKATDPTKWSVVDGGGFVGLESEDITDAVAIGDTIYISGKKKTYAYTYTIDPNSDGFLRSIYSGPFIQTMCVFDTMVYAANGYTLYAIFNNNLEEVIDFSKVFKNIGYGDEVRKIVQFGDSLIIQRGYPETLINPTSSEANETYFYNVKNQSLHQIQFQDALSPDGFNWDDPNYLPGKIIDVEVVNSGREATAYFAVKHTYRGISPNENRTRFYFMNQSRTEFYPQSTWETYSQAGYDIIHAGDGTSRNQSIKFEVEIENWAPDGSFHLMKRFRGIQLEGLIPTNNNDDGRLRVYYDKGYTALGPSEYVFKYMKDQPVHGPDERIPFSYVFRVNQKSKKLSLRFLRVQDSNGPYVGASEQSGMFFFITGIKVLWSYSGNRGSQQTIEYDTSSSHLS